MTPPDRPIGRPGAHGVLGDQRRYRLRPACPIRLTVGDPPPDLRLSGSYLAARSRSRHVFITSGDYT